MISLTNSIFSVTFDRNGGLDKIIVESTPTLRTKKAIDIMPIAFFALTYNFAESILKQLLAKTAKL